ncbi:MAG: tail fiber protein [Planctomycetaceae bacterium]|nr:tail fiber protein [Planctomycetaceae bacterium]
MITTSTIERRFTGNGVAVTFPVDIEGIPDAPVGAAHLAVSVLDGSGGERALVYGADFSYAATVVNGFSKSVVVTVTAPVPAGATLVVRRTTPIVSISSYPDDKTPSRQVERDFDNTIKIIQEVDAKIEGVAAEIPPILEDMSSLHAADAALARDIAAEASTRAGADAAESQARSDADAAEAATRAQADAALSMAIDGKAEKTYVDAELRTKADITEVRRLDEVVDTKAPKTLASENNPGLMAPEDKAKLDSVGIATATHVGLVKPDNITTMIDPDGTLHAAGAGGGTVDHRAMAHRDAPDQHPDTAVTRGEGPGTVGEAITALENGAAATVAEIAAQASATADALAKKAPLANPQFTGTVGVNGRTVGSMAFVADAPPDGKEYVRKNNAWAQGGSPFPLMVGQVTPYFGAVGNKSAFEPNFLYADGRAVSRTQYPELFAAYGVIYGAGNGSSTFNLPDLRGVFVRGMDEGRGLDSSRSLGFYQGDAIRNITGTWSSGATGQHGPLYLTQHVVTGAFKRGASVAGYDTSHGNGASFQLDFDASQVVPTAHENRPVNMACHWFIVAQSPTVASSSDFTAAINAVNASMGTIRNEVVQNVDSRLGQILHVQERQPNNVNGGTFTAGAWRTRNLNTLISNTIAGASFDPNSSQIILPAGTYWLYGAGCGYTVDRHKVTIHDVIASKELLLGTSEVSGTTVASTAFSTAKGYVVLPSQTRIELRHYCQVSRATTGFGLANNFGTQEIYAEVIIRRIK